MTHSTSNLLNHSEFRHFIESFSNLRQITEKLSLAEGRRLSTQFFLSSDTVYEKIKRIENIEITGPEQNRIPIRFFIPQEGALLPVLIYFHRGGWVFGNIEEADPVCRKLANHLNCIVASVEYRLAPEHPFPKPLEDCYAATLWIANHAACFGGNPQRLMVAGESAGGNLAAAVALMTRDKKGPSLERQLLIYPIITSTIQDAPYDNCPDQYFLTKDAMKFFWSMYLSSPDHAQHPYASLDYTKDLSGLPPALIITAEYDPLRQEAEQYGQHLHQAGVRVSSKCIPQVIHGFLDLPIYEEHQKVGWIKEIAQLLNRRF